MGEIAERAGVGRGTLFRNFPSKDALVVAVVVERIRESLERGRALLGEEDPATAAVRADRRGARRARPTTARSSRRSSATGWPIRRSRPPTRRYSTCSSRSLARAQAAGAIRPDVGGVDVMMLIKGVCEVQRAVPRAAARHRPPAAGARQSGAHAAREPARPVGRAAAARGPRLRRRRPRGRRGRARRRRARLGLSAALRRPRGRAARRDRPARASRPRRTRTRSASSPPRRARPRGSRAARAR